MSIKKKLIAVITVFAMLISSLAIGFSAYGVTFKEIGLDIIYTGSLNGAGDMVWYTYTPELSGTYCFLNYSVGKSQAYLYTVTVNENGSKTYNGLAYAPASDPNSNDEYHTFEFAGKTYTHTSTSFRLTCHLEAGTTYYFSAGWATEKQTTGTMNVRLTNIEYDYQVLDSVSVSSEASLTWYTDGEWRTDKNGVTYFYYNYSKIIQNMVVTIKYKDGSTSSSVMGANTVDGYQISYAQNQDENHWYVKEADEYKGNYITVTVMGVSCDFDVPIKQGAMYTVKGAVSDIITGEPIPKAELQIKGLTVATTDGQGKFTFGYAPGVYNMSVKAKYGVTRNITVVVDAKDTQNNDHTDTPVELLIIDYIQDGEINGKDFGYLVKNKMTEKQNKFGKYAGFTTDSYSNLKL